MTDTNELMIYEDKKRLSLLLLVCVISIAVFIVQASSCSPSDRVLYICFVCSAVILSGMIIWPGKRIIFPLKRIVVSEKGVEDCFMKTGFNPYHVSPGVS